jgi:hypothetical protein
MDELTRENQAVGRIESCSSISSFEGFTVNRQGIVDTFSHWKHGEMIFHLPGESFKYSVPSIVHLLVTRHAPDTREDRLLWQAWSIGSVRRILLRAGVTDGRDMQSGIRKRNTQGYTVRFLQPVEHDDIRMRVAKKNEEFSSSAGFEP